MTAARQSGARRPRARHRGSTMRPSVTAPATTRTVAKLAASMRSCPSARRHSSEFAANASIAIAVSASTRPADDRVSPGGSAAIRCPGKPWGPRLLHEYVGSRRVADRFVALLRGAHGRRRDLARRRVRLEPLGPGRPPGALRRLDRLEELLRRRQPPARLSRAHPVTALRMLRTADDAGVVATAR